MSRAKVQAGGIIRSAIDTTWQTPEWLLEVVRPIFPDRVIPFDPATAPNNPTKAERFCAGPAGTLFAKDTLESKNGLEVSWDWPFWVNPPFKREWIEKIGREGEKTRGIALLPNNRTEMPFMQHALKIARSICFVDAEPFQRGLQNPHRIAFISSLDGVPCTANPYASIVLGFGFDFEAFTHVLHPLGLCVELRKAG